MSALAAALEALGSGGVVACPTETLVGLLADATNPEAIERVLRAKGRGAEKTIALLVPSLESAREVAELGPLAESLARAHWPGPLTIVARARGAAHPALVRDGKLGLRVPGASPALALVEAYGRPLTATSANLSGAPAVADTRALEPAVRAAVDAVVEGASPGGAPSTVVDLSGSVPTVIRPGAISLDF